MKKIIKIVLIIVVIAVIGWIFFFLKEKNNPDYGQLRYNFDSAQLTETYTDKVNGFSIKYPTGWTIGQTVDFETFAYVLIFGPESADLTVKVWKKESSSKNPDDRPFIDKIQSVPAVIAYIKDSLTGRCGPDKASEISVAGLETRKMICTIGFFDSAGSAKTTYYLVEKGNIFEVEYTTGRSRLKDSKSLERLFERITETFAFTK